MDKLLAYITTTLRSVCSESYYDKNNALNVVYPYCTFDIGTSMNTISRNQEIVALDIDIFDINSSYKNIFDIETELKALLYMKRDLTTSFSAIWKYVRATNIPTGEDQLLRRSLQLEITIDWRTI